MLRKVQIVCSLVATVFILLLASSVDALTPQDRAASLRGRVMDESGAVIPGAVVNIRGPENFEQIATTDEGGTYQVDGLAPGAYVLTATAPGFTISAEVEVEGRPGRNTTHDFSLTVAPIKQEVTVNANQDTAVSLEADNNVGAIVLRGADLDMLSDDPDDLAAELQALAGPGAGPQGGQIYVDGFSGASIPPKDSIREIRINSDPFSAQYDRLGFGRIQIFTRPGSDRFRGRLSAGFSDESLNARNPFSSNQPSYQSRLFSGSLSGPAGKKASFNLDFQRREIDGNAVINATILDAGLNPVSFSESVVTPQRRTTFGPRIDYQLSEDVTLTGRYRFSKNDRQNSGIGGFSLPAVGFDNNSEGHTVQLTVNALISHRTINETRMQYRRDESGQIGDNSIPTVSVLEAFTDGGARVGLSGNESNSWEIHNNTTLVRGKHTLKFGGRFRRGADADISVNNFGGTFTFGGGFAPQLDANDQIILDAGGQPTIVPITSIERYRRTLVFLAQGLTGPQIRALGGGATQFTLSAGIPDTRVSQMDLGVFLLDDWRALSNLSLSFGLRYEGGSGQNGKTVVRGGFGMFFERVSRNLTLQTLRLDGTRQQQFIIQDPDFYPVVPDPVTLTNQLAPQTIREFDPDIRSPYMLQSAIGLERSLPANTVVSTTYSYTRGLHILRSRNLNAPDPVTGIRPFGSDSVFLYEATGNYRQNRLITTIRTRFARGISLFGYYAINKASSDSDGSGDFPANPLDLDADFGRASNDNRQRILLGGSVPAPWGFSFSPFLIWTSGGPFDITTGRDNNGDLIFNDRPSFATNLTDSDVVVTRFGTFDLTPEPGDSIIPRNFADGPSRTIFNLRVGKTWGFGTREREADSEGQGSDPRANRRGRGGRGGRGGRRGGFGGFGRGRGGFGGGSADSRYTLSLTASFQNILNLVNQGRPIGNLSSSLFGVSNSLAGFGRGGSAAGNRTISLRLSFSF
jgi:hypothetical protein